MLWFLHCLEAFTERTLQAEFDLCFFISQQTGLSFPSRLDSASTVGSRTRLLLLCGHPRAQSGTVLLQSLAYCSSWLLLRMGSRNEPRQACIKLGKQVSAGMWQAAQPGFWHPKWVLEPAVLELVAAPG